MAYGLSPTCCSRRAPYEYEFIDECTLRVARVTDQIVEIP